MIRVHDSDGDEIRVFAQDGQVWIDVTDNSLAREGDPAPDFATACLDTEAARALATAITRCADQLQPADSYVAERFHCSACTANSAGRRLGVEDVIKPPERSMPG